MISRSVRIEAEPSHHRAHGPAGIRSAAAADASEQTGGASRVPAGA
jgi:hypothetical protein